MISSIGGLDYECGIDELEELDICDTEIDYLLNYLTNHSLNALSPS
jgi:hypothetical protein